MGKKTGVSVFRSMSFSLTHVPLYTLGHCDYLTIRIAELSFHPTSSEGDANSEGLASGEVLANSGLIAS